MGGTQVASPKAFPADTGRLFSGKTVQEAEAWAKRFGASEFWYYAQEVGRGILAAIRRPKKTEVWDEIGHAMDREFKG